MPVLTSLLDTFRLKAQVFHNAQYCGSWAVDTSGSTHALFHLVLDGQCVFRLRERPDEVYELDSGDLIVVPRDASHMLGTPDCPPSQVNRTASVPYDQGLIDGAVSLMCGYFEFDPKESNPVVAALPAVLRVRTRDSEHRGLLEPVLAALLHESRSPNPGSQIVINRLAEVLFVHVVRLHLAQDVQTPGLAAALANPGIARALAQVHQDPDKKWSVADLAGIAGMSRSTFADRFRKLAGMAPMDYCTRWRMQCAYRWLEAEGSTVLEVALRCGYQSESAFSRAFRRVFGFNPSTVRRGRNTA